MKSGVSGSCIRCRSSFGCPIGRDVLLVLRCDCMSDSAGSSSAGFAEGPVHRAFGLLQLVVAAGEPVGVRELARRAGLARSTTSRMLAILAELGMVERTPDGGARPGAA